MKTYNFKNGAAITIYYENRKKLYMVTYRESDTFCIPDITSWATAKEIAENVLSYIG